jgi:hypothetical protein
MAIESNLGTTSLAGITEPFKGSAFRSLDHLKSKEKQTSNDSTIHNLTIGYI